MGDAIRRRDFLRVAGSAGIAAAGGGALAACGISDKPARKAAGRAGNAGPAVKLGFMPASDAASVFMAKELGYFAERGLHVELARQVSFAAMRDNLLNGEIDGAHALYSNPLAVATGIAGSGTFDIKIAMLLSANGQSITLKKDFVSAGYANLAAAKALLDRGPVTIGITFPGGNHDVFLRYWIRAAGADPANVRIVTIPPPQMVANMKVNNMDGYSAGEPWAYIGVEEAGGFTHLLTQDLWLNHPEKALIVGPGLTTRQDVLADVIGAILKAGKWLDDLDNRRKAIPTICGPAYINTPQRNVESRLLGHYDLGDGLGTRTSTDDRVAFFQNGAVPALRRSHVLWFLAQYQRLGLVKQAPDYHRIADGILMRDLYNGVAEKEGVPVPDDDMAPIRIKLDGALFDPSKPAEEVKRS